MQKIDLKKDLKYLYQPSAKKVILVEVPKMNFLKIDGKGSPDSESYQQSVETLYSLSYAIKFNLKKKGISPDFTVMPRMRVGHEKILVAYLRSSALFRAPVYCYVFSYYILFADF